MLNKTDDASSARAAALSSQFFQARVRARESADRYMVALETGGLAELAAAAEAAVLDAGFVAALARHLVPRR